MEPQNRPILRIFAETLVVIRDARRAGDSCDVGCFRFVDVPDLLSVFYSDESLKWHFLCLTQVLGTPIFSKIDAGGDKLETCS